MYQCIVPTLRSFSNIHVIICMTYNICIHVYISLWVLGFLCYYVRADLLWTSPHVLPGWAVNLFNHPNIH